MHGKRKTVGSSLRSRILNPLAWAFFLGASRVSCLLGRRFSYRLADCVAFLWFYLLPVRKGVTLENLRSALGDVCDESKLRRIAFRTYRNLCWNITDLLTMPLLTRENVSVWVEVEGMEHLNAAFSAGKGALVFAAHYGSWDFLCCAMALMGVRAQILTKDLKWDPANRFWQEMRDRFGLGQIHFRGGIRPVLNRLRSNDVVAIVMDQHCWPEHGCIVNFFGRPAATLDTVALLHLRTGAPVIPVRILRLPGGRHRIVFSPPVPYVTVGDDPKENIRYNVQRYNDVIEGWIRERPDHWLWLHRRWKV